MMENHVPDNKSHHYVPRFYLRNFSRHWKCINLFNIDSQRQIKNAPIKGQCCRDYFYGKSPENEKSLSAAEGEVAQLFRFINEQVRLPHYFTAGHLLLCFHIATQAGRTQYAADAVNELTDSMMREVLKHEPNITHDMLAQVSFGYDAPALISTAQGALSFPLLMDLECRVLLAPQGAEFITSDNPVVMYNQFMMWRTDGSNTGIASKGLQIFFPIWPFLTLVMYDRDVYHFGSTKSAFVHMASEIDVHELNMLQVASASKNVYTFTSAANIFKVTQDAAKYRRKKKSVVKTFPQPSKGSRKTEIIATSREDIRTNAILGFIRVHKRAKVWLKEFRSHRFQPAVVIRDKALMTRFEAHVEAVKNGKACTEDVIKSVFGKTVEDGTF
jgi:hypothetical protein